MAFAAGSSDTAICWLTKHFGGKSCGVACGDQAQIRAHGSMQRTSAATAASAAAAAAATVCRISLLCLALRRIYAKQEQEHIVVEQKYKKKTVPGA